MNLYTLIVENDEGIVQIVAAPPTREVLDECVRMVNEIIERNARVAGRPSPVFLNPTKRGPKAKQVYITAIAEDSDFAFLKLGDTFESAAELSTQLGYKYDAAGVQLRSLLRRPHEEQRVALKGVTFCYTESLANSVRD